MTPEEIKALIAEAIKEASSSFAQIANDAATAHTKRMAKEFEAKLPKATEPVAAPDPQAAAAADKIKADPAMAALQAQIADLKKQNDIETKARKAAEDKQRNDSAFGSLKGLLSGVKPELQDAAAKLLFHVESRVKFDESGVPLFKMKGESGEDIDYPLESGVEQWMKSKDAMAFLPAPATGGGPGRGGRAPGAIPTGRSANGMPVYDKKATSDEERVARAAEKEAALKRVLGRTEL